MVFDCLHHRGESTARCHPAGPAPAPASAPPGFVPWRLRAHPDGAVFVAASERGMVQCFDIALTPIRYIVEKKLKKMFVMLLSFICPPLPPSPIPAYCRLQFSHSDHDPFSAGSSPMAVLDCAQYFRQPSSMLLADLQFCPRGGGGRGDWDSPMAAAATNYLAIRFQVLGRGGGNT